MTSASESSQGAGPTDVGSTDVGSTDVGSTDVGSAGAARSDQGAAEPSPSGSASSDAGAAEAGSKLREKRADESWKERAHKEKEKLSARAATERPQMPPASFLGLLEELAIRAMLSLGQVHDPISGEVSLNLEGAKYAIDLLGILEAKTKGNLEPAEAAAVADLLHNLRLSFVQISKNPPTPEELLAAGRAHSGRGGAPRGEGGGPEADPPGPKIIL
jgi:hypothetical protein